VFALLCLAEEPDISPATAARVFNAAIETLQDEDGFLASPKTSMDVALATIAGTSLGESLREALLATFVESRGCTETASWPVFLHQACAAEHDPGSRHRDEIIATACIGLRSAAPSQRVGAALN